MTGADYNLPADNLAVKPYPGGPSACSLSKLTVTRMMFGAKDSNTTFEGPRLNTICFCSAPAALGASVADNIIVEHAAKSEGDNFMIHSLDRS